ncbi:MAG: AAA family ATPase [Bacteroidetes bacterium]|nr:MAG: AAA family ATPase [Bacteroidota bacterium]
MDENKTIKTSITQKDIQNEAVKLANTPTDGTFGLFAVHTANGWIDAVKNKPQPRMLFSEFWHEGELCILFADTNLGKSILAVQMGDSISRGQPIPGFALQTPPQKVLYFDFELSGKQFEIRYMHPTEGHYQFSHRFHRAEIDPDADLPVGFTDYETFLYQSFEQAILHTGSQIIIIDNITYLKNETEKAKDALPLMKLMKALKTKHNLSILALAHTPKRDLAKPITRNDLQGSKMLINFCDSAFAIGESTQSSQLRYLKQIKQRNTAQLYGAENVCVCRIDKPLNFLQFEFLNYSYETEHLHTHEEAGREQLIDEVKQLSKCGHSQRQIASQLGLSLGVVNKYINL